MALIYKTLFEVKLMHEYYLTRQDGTHIFAQANQPARLDFLLEDFHQSRPSINDDLYFEFPKQSKDAFEGLGLKLLPTYSGLRVVARVEAITLPDLTIAYRPLGNIPSWFNLFILVCRKNRSIDTYTNSRVNRSLPGTYFFSNLGSVTTRSFPFLTHAVPSKDDSFSYEQGELARTATGLQEFYRQGGSDQWNDVIGTGFANESDRILLSSRFNYSFPNNTDLTAAEFQLTNENGDVIARVSKENANGLDKTQSLDFSDNAIALPLSGRIRPGDFLYTLKVSGNNGYSATHAAIFNNELINANPWAVIQVGITADQPAFHLFDNDGLIIRRRNPSGDWTPAPVFEIPVKSRLAYWRFVEMRGRSISAGPTLGAYLTKEGNTLVTNQPRTLARSWFSLRKPGSTDTAYVPNPEFPELSMGTDRRLFFDVRVPESDLFIVNNT